MLRAFVACLIGLATVSSVAPLIAQPPGRAPERPITFVIHVPAEAQIEVEGVKTAKTGETREFKTPDIAVGRKYSYAIKITFQGKTTSHQLTMTHAGPNVFDFRKELTAARPATPPPSGPSFTLFSPATVTLRAGDAGPFTVKIKREVTNGAVELSFRGLPAGVQINDATIPAGKDEQSVLAMSEASARPGTSVVEVVAKSGRVQKQANFRLTITAAAAPPPVPPKDPGKEAAKKDTKPRPPPDDLPPAEPPPMPPGSDAKKPPGEPKKPE